MAINLYNIKKWTKMLSGRSLLHVNQGCGTCFVPGEVKGYFNDLTQKVLNDPGPMERHEVPAYPTEKGTMVTPVGVFQYGLGAYDLYLRTNEEKYKNAFEMCVRWAVSNILADGGWINPQVTQGNSFSSMTQGEGAALLVRGYIEFGNIFYLSTARNALNKMLQSIDEGGTSDYTDGLVLFEFPDAPAVLNGWVFSLFGLYDFCQVTPDEKYQEALNLTLKTLEKQIDLFDNGYWSKYDCDKRIASPFYHDLHIAQLTTLLQVYPSKRIENVRDNFIADRDSRLKRTRAFCVKVKQKIFE